MSPGYDPATNEVTVTSAPRRLGRPRLVEQTLDIEPTEHILLVAGRLFTERGYQATTTREIAEAAGLRQGSLYHYFGRKEDILAELLDRIADGALTMAAWIADEDAGPAASLWALGYLDVSNSCSGSYNVALLARLPDARQPRFAGFWATRDRLHAAYEALLERGRREGVLVVDDLGLTSSLLRGLVEGPVDWFDPVQHDRADVARLTARAVLLAVLADPGALAHHIADGEALASRAPRAPASAVAPPDR